MGYGFVFFFFKKKLKLFYLITRGKGLADFLKGWARWMEYLYPAVEVVVTDKAVFKGIGAVEAAVSL